MLRLAVLSLGLPAVSALGHSEPLESSAGLSAPPCVRGPKTPWPEGSCCPSFSVSPGNSPLSCRFFTLVAVRFQFRPHLFPLGPESLPAATPGPTGKRASSAGAVRYQVSTSYRALPTGFRDAINECTAHLTWSRPKAPLPNFQNIGDGVEKSVEYVLAEAFAFVQQITQQSSGIQLIEKHHQTYWERLKELRAKLI
jgi:hypothetical protein